MTALEVATVRPACPALVARAVARLGALTARAAGDVHAARCRGPSARRPRAVRACRREAELTLSSGSGCRDRGQWCAARGTALGPAPCRRTWSPPVAPVPIVLEVPRGAWAQAVRPLPAAQIAPTRKSRLGDPVDVRIGDQAPIRPAQRPAHDGEPATEDDARCALVTVTVAHSRACFLFFPSG
jgi:hypothetical protein